MVVPTLTEAAIGTCQWWNDHLSLYRKRPISAVDRRYRTDVYILVWMVILVGAVVGASVLDGGAVTRILSGIVVYRALDLLFFHGLAILKREYREHLDFRRSLVLSAMTIPQAAMVALYALRLADNSHPLRSDVATAFDAATLRGLLPSETWGLVVANIWVTVTVLLVLAVVIASLTGNLGLTETTPE